MHVPRIAGCLAVRNHAPEAHATMPAEAGAPGMTRRSARTRKDKMRYTPPDVAENSTSNIDKQSPRPRGLRGRVAELAAVAILIALPYLVYLPVTTGYATFAGFDHTGINQPLKQEAFDTLRTGHLPLWEHRLDRGLPLYAEGEAGIFYPLNWLFLIPCDFLTLYNLVLLLILSVAGLLFYWWVRKLGAGSLAAFLAATAHQWGATVNFNKANMNILEGVILVPLMMILIEPETNPGWMRSSILRRGGAIALVFAAILFAGQAQYLVYTGLFGLIYIILRVIFSGKSGWKSTLHKMGLPFVIGSMLGAGIAAIQLLPTLELIPLSERGVSTIQQRFSTLGLWLSPSRLFATFIFPAYHYSLDHFLPYLSTTVYIGPVAILLAGCAIRRRADFKSPVILPLFIAGLIFLYLSMGANAPLGGWLTSWGPLAQFRGHGRLGGYFAMAMVALMGLGLDSLLKNKITGMCEVIGRRKCMPMFIPELVIMALLMIPFITHRAEYVETRHALGLMFGFITIFFAGFLISNCTKSRIPLAISVAVAIAIQVIGFQATSSETILARSSWDADTADIQYISNSDTPPEENTIIALRTQASVLMHQRILENGFSAFEQGAHSHIDYLGSANAGLMYDLTICNADLPLEPGRWEKLIHQGVWSRLDTTHGTLEDPLDSKLLWVLGINWIVTENPDLEIPNIVGQPMMVTDVEGNTIARKEFERLADPAWNNRGIPYYIYRRLSPVRPYTVFRNWTVASTNNETEIMDEFESFISNNDPGRQVYIEDPAGSGSVTGTPAGTPGQSFQSVVSKAEWKSPTEYSVVVNVSHDSIFMLRDQWYPGWKVYVDNNEAPLLRANAVFKAVQLTRGRHEVVFRYVPTRLRTGQMVTLASVIIVTVFLGWKGNTARGHLFGRRGDGRRHPRE